MWHLQEVTTFKKSKQGKRHLSLHLIHMLATASSTGGKYPSPQDAYNLKAKTHRLFLIIINATIVMFSISDVNKKFGKEVLLNSVL